MQVQNYKIYIMDPNTDQDIYELSTTEEIRGLFANNILVTEVFEMFDVVYEITQINIVNSFIGDDLSVIVKVHVKKIGVESDFEEK